MCSFFFLAEAFVIQGSFDRIFILEQEKRMNKATEVMMQYVENLKRTYEKDHAELMEFKKLANQNSSRCGASADSGGKTRFITLFQHHCWPDLHTYFELGTFHSDRNFPRWLEYINAVLLRNIWGKQ